MLIRYFSTCSLISPDSGRANCSTAWRRPDGPAQVPMIKINDKDKDDKVKTFQHSFQFVKFLSKCSPKSKK